MCINNNKILNINQNYSITNSSEGARCRGVSIERAKSIYFAFFLIIFNFRLYYSSGTYPLVTQTVLTNGQHWSFCVYQLNTTLSHSEYADNNPMRNMCWITEPMLLFEKVEDGKVHGFNEDVLKMLIAFYINKPVQKNEYMTPYLSESVKHIVDIADVGRRTWLESTFKHLMSNRPRHVKKPEIYHWQKIYMIDNKTRPMDKKPMISDSWQFGWSGMKRRLNQHAPPYVPKCLRENSKLKRVGHFAKRHYPNS